VLVDKGRYLVVDVDAAAVPLADGPHASSYAVRPLPADTVVFDQRAAGPGRITAPVREANVPADAVSGTAPDFVDSRGLGSLGGFEAAIDCLKLDRR
jgi:hypothetical protein